MEYIWKLFFWRDENDPEIKNYYLANGNYNIDIDEPLDVFCKKYGLRIEYSVQNDPTYSLGWPLLVGKPDLLIKDGLTDLETINYQIKHGNDEVWPYINLNRPTVSPLGEKII